MNIAFPSLVFKLEESANRLWRHSQNYIPYTSGQPNDDATEFSPSREIVHIKNQLIRNLKAFNWGELAQRVEDFPRELGVNEESLSLGASLESLLGTLDKFISLSTGEAPVTNLHNFYEQDEQRPADESSGHSDEHEIQILREAIREFTTAIIRQLNLIKAELVKLLVEDDVNSMFIRFIKHGQTSSKDPISGAGLRNQEVIIKALNLPEAYG